ncbi:hypothetical protein [Tardiphaga sp. 42S5]|uniref:hypothetical protein n=1 Tax=Tardiphaga sp. 42S5 TaxID=1404799 RepID=UPI002A5AC907|nr:hypothetical protein [Tardiphaga sp. 42S5]WPO42524.1 hypothetical protein SFY93_05035 [Tardiphaga sp. 42S5]
MEYPDQVSQRFHAGGPRWRLAHCDIANTAIVKRKLPNCQLFQVAARIAPAMRDAYAVVIDCTENQSSTGLPVNEGTPHMLFAPFLCTA